MNEQSGIDTSQLQGDSQPLPVAESTQPVQPEATSNFIVASGSASIDNLKQRAAANPVPENAVPQAQTPEQAATAQLESVQAQLKSFETQVMSKLEGKLVTPETVTAALKEAEIEKNGLTPEQAEEKILTMREQLARGGMDRVLATIGDGARDSDVGTLLDLFLRSYSQEGHSSGGVDVGESKESNSISLTDFQEAMKEPTRFANNLYFALHDGKLGTEMSREFSKKGIDPATVEAGLVAIAKGGTDMTSLLQVMEVLNEYLFETIDPARKDAHWSKARVAIGEQMKEHFVLDAQVLAYLEQQKKLRPEDRDLNKIVSKKGTVIAGQFGTPNASAGTAATVTGQPATVAA